MNKSKNIIVILLLLLLITGCNNKEDKNKTEEVKSTNVTTEKVSSSTTTTQTTTKMAPTSTKTTTTTTKKITTTTTSKKCTPKKFNKKYTYVYKTKEECDKNGINDYYYLYDNEIIKELYYYGCDKIVDECGDTYYGVHFVIWTGPGNDDYKTIYY